MNEIIHPHLFWSTIERITQMIPANARAAKAVANILSRDFDEQFATIFSDKELERSNLRPAVWRALKDKAAKKLRPLTASEPDPRILTLARQIALLPEEAELLSLSIWLAQCPASRNLGESLLLEANWSRNRAIAALSGLSPAAIASALAPKGRLALADLIDIGSQYRGSDLGLDPTNTMDFALSSSGEISDALVPSGGPVEVIWQDYNHLAPQRDFALKLLQGALQSGAAGVNILLHGPPGTGKTQLCHLLAQELAADLRVVRSGDEHNGYGSLRDKRMQHYDLAQLLFAGKPETLILFDEIEDLLPSFNMFAPVRSGKAQLNTLFEENAVPVLWTTNDISGIPESIRRRISYSIEMRLPPEMARRKIWRRLALSENSGFSSAQIDRIAREHPVAPAVLKNALRTASLASGETEDAEFVLNAARGLIEGAMPVKPPAGHFDSALTRSDFDLPALLARLKGAGERPVSLCLSGPPGTGKSAFARHLAAEMGLEVLQKRASDLISKYVGDSEKNIAAAFAEARANRAFLIFDEADSLLTDRSGAARSWEVSQVNEMLTWMESHPLPFACTTNLIDRLDPASMRRFTFKLGFEALDAAQQGLAFERFFHAEAPKSIAGLSGLTPGDFACVLSRIDWLSDRSAEGLVRELGRELAARQTKTNPIGFRPN